MSQTDQTNIPKISENRKSSNSEETTMQSDKKRGLQNNLAKNKYLSIFKKWPVLSLVEENILLRMDLAMIHKDGALIATKDKIVYAIGHNKNNRLRLGQKIISTLLPKKVDILCGKNIKKFNLHFNKRMSLIHTVLTEEGEIYLWDERQKHRNQILTYNPKQLEIDNKLADRSTRLNINRIIDIANSIYDRFALSIDGKVYKMSLNWDKPVLKSNEIIFYVDKEKHFDENKIVSIASGFDFHMAVTDKGELYSWGFSNFGVLGIGGSSDEFKKKTTWRYYKVPQKITELSNAVIIKVACGFAHTLALTDEGQVYVWGFKQSTTQQNKDTYYPELLNIPNLKKILDIGAIFHNERSAVLGDDGHIYIWGSFNNKYCVNKTDCWITTPIVTQFLNIEEALSRNEYPICLSKKDLGYIDIESDILKCSQALFDDSLTSDFKILVEEQPIYVHKAILKVRSTHFGAMFQPHWKESKDNVLTINDFSYIIYKSFLKYLYTGVIDLPTQKLHELLDLAIIYCETKLERSCKREIGLMRKLR